MVTKLNDTVRNAMPPTSLYVHVPFCARRCSYCDFAVEATREPPVHAWIAAVARELELTAEEQEWSEPLLLRTLYIGGGTPSLLGTGAMARFREAIEPRARLAPGAEWTSEANPESFTTELARDWRSAGVNRISLGAQSFHAPTLRWMGRLHGPDGPERAVAAAREAGFDDVSIDLIFGLPERLGRDWAADLEKTLALGTDHVSLYGLTAEPGAPLGRWVDEGRERLADEDRYADEYLAAHLRLTRAGFEHYEVSNFALPGRRSRHNPVYWSGAPYAALGPGAHAYFPPERRWNLRSWRAYRETVEAGRLPIDGRETVSHDDRSLERVWLGLRTAEGIDLAGLTDSQAARVGAWVADGLARLLEGTVRLTPRGWLLLDQLAIDLHGADHAESPLKSRVPIDVRGELVQIGANSNPFRR